MTKWLIGAAMALAWATSIFYIYGLGALAGMYAPQMALNSMKRAAPIAQLFIGGDDRRPCDAEDTTSCGFQNTKGRTEVDCADFSDGNSAVLMTFGQSNSANAGRDRYIPLGPVANFNIHDGKCYLAEDPLLGPDGEGGSVWGVLADKLIAQGYYENVLLVPFGIGGTPLSRWTAGGDLHKRISHTAALLGEAGITPTHVLWHQGEADTKHGTATDDYFAMFKAMAQALQGYGIDAPVYPAVVSVCAMPISKPAPDYQQKRERVRAAQLRLPEIEGVKAGPDTDTVKGRLYRYDGCHFNHKGMQAHAGLWLQAITDE